MAYIKLLFYKLFSRILKASSDLFPNKIFNLSTPNLYFNQTDPKEILNSHFTFLFPFFFCYFFFLIEIGVYLSNSSHPLKARFIIIIFKTTTSLFVPE